MFNKPNHYITIITSLLLISSGLRAEAAIGVEHSPHLTNTQEASFDIFQYAKAYRKNTDLSPEEENLRSKNILEQVFSSLTKYDHHSSLESAVGAFLENALSLEKEDFSIINANSTDIGGKSSDAVFLVQDRTGELLYVVKAFKNPRSLSGRFLPEISSLEFIEKLSIPGVQPIRPLAYAAYSSQGEEWGLLLETAAKGLRIDQFIYRLGVLRPDSKEREAYFTICQLVFRRLGESFARLHAEKSTRPSPVLSQDIERFDQKVSKILENPLIMQAIQTRFSADAFFLYLENVRAEALKASIFYSYWHGDAHLGNLFYDADEDRVAFIDVAKLHRSLSINDEPLLDGTIDLVRVEENLRRIALGYLSEAEVEKLLGSFYESYNKESCQPLSQSVFFFHKTGKKLGRLVEYARFDEEQDPLKKKEDQAVFESALDYFENQISLK